MTHLDSQAEIENLLLSNARLELENSDYRNVITNLASDISSLDAAIQGLSFRARNTELSDSRVEATPRLLKISSTRVQDVGTVVPSQSLDVLGNLLRILGQRLEFVRHGVARREAFIDATPSSWPNKQPAWMPSPMGDSPWDWV